MQEGQYVAGGGALVSPNQGDIILDTGAKKQNNRWLIVVLALLVVVAVVIGIILLLGKNVGPKNADYYLERYGEKLQEGGETAEYYSELRESFNAFYEKAKEEEKYQEYVEDMEKVGALIDKVAFLKQIKQISDEDVLEKYFEGGYDAAMRYVWSVYNQKTDDYEMGVYLIDMKNYYSVLLKSTSFYNEVGCISNKVINSDCPFSIRDYNSPLYIDIKEGYSKKNEWDEYINGLYWALSYSYDAIKENEYAYY